MDRFALRLRDRPARVGVVRGLCVPMGESGLPFAPVLGVLRSLEDLHGGDALAAWAAGGRDALATLLPELRDPAGAAPAGDLQLQLFEAVVRVLRGAAGVRPLVVVVEDVHWADGSSRSLLQFAARTLGDAPVLLVLTFRPDEASGARQLRGMVDDLARLPGAVRLPLRRLDRREVAALLAALDGRAPGAARIDDVRRRSDGVPLYVEELAAIAPGRRELPASLRGALEARTGLLPEEARPTLALAAVAGPRVPHALLVEATAEPTAVDDHLRAAVDVGLLRVDDDSLAFRHALFAEAVYADLLPGERTLLHARLADALERRPDLARGTADHAVALHRLAAGDADRAFGAAVRAMRSTTVAHAETLAMHERVLELWNGVEDPEGAAGPRVEVLTGAARSARHAGDYDRALELVGEALEVGGADDAAGRADRLLLRALLLLDSLRPGAEADLALAEELLPRVADPATRAELLERAARMRLNLGADPLPAARRAVAAARAAGARATEADAQVTLGSALVAECEDVAGIAELEAAVGAEAAGVHTRLRAQLNLSDSLHLTGRYQEAVDVAPRRPPRGRGARGRAVVRHLPRRQRRGVDARHRQLVTRRRPARRGGGPSTRRPATAPTSSCSSPGC
ncbi:AAA family ATPase [Nocardioides sp. TF02-7]|nr:AAA family ATPase [Nocardioides sp. TF02-7]